MVRVAGAGVTRGWGAPCPYLAGRRYEDWELPDPAGQPIEVVREVRDEIGQKVLQLIGTLEFPTGT